MTALACTHPLDRDTGRLCGHVVADDDTCYFLRFTGRGAEHVLVCPACREAPLEGLTTVCAACFEEAHWCLFSAEGIIGAPEVLSRQTELRFEHNEITVPALAKLSVRSVVPHPDPSKSIWLAVTDRGDLARINLQARIVDPILSLAAAGLEVEQDVAVHASPCGRFAAIVNQKGRHGIVADLTTGATTMALDRGTYHEDVCEFSIAFFRDGERTLLIHATDWNRLDISDPATGALLTARDTQCPPGAQRPPHDLDYFHSGLTVSPGGRWLVDDGWVWHPVGMIHAIDLQRWLHENVWESEDGPSLVRFRQAAYFWDGPRCFIEEGILATGGFGPDDEIMVDGALLFDVATGKRLRWFAGPPRRGAFVFDEWLFASAANHGTSVWDVKTGELVCHEPGLLPAGYHRGARCFLTVGEGGRLRLSALKPG